MPSDFSARRTGSAMALHIASWRVARRPRFPMGIVGALWHGCASMRAFLLRWLPLFHRTIRLETVELDSPHVALDRLQSGDINLMALVPKSAETAPAEEKPKDEKPAEPSGWHFGIDYVGLKRGGVRFRDLLVPGS